MGILLVVCVQSMLQAADVQPPKPSIVHYARQTLHTLIANTRLKKRQSVLHLENAALVMDKSPEYVEVANIFITRDNGVEILQKEQDLLDEKYRVMYHGQKDRYAYSTDFRHSLYNALADQGLYSKHLPDDFRYIQTPSLMWASEHKLLRPVIDAVDYVQHKVRMLGAIFEESGLGEGILCMNAFLFGNMTKYGSCTISYVYDNKSATARTTGLKDGSESLGVPEVVYNRYSDRILALWNQHDACLGRRGRLLQIAIKNIDDATFISSGYRMKTKQPLDGITHTNTSTLLDAFDNAPQEKLEDYAMQLDQVQFCAPLTRQYMLNPDKVKVIAYNDITDKEGYAQCMQKMVYLTAEIARETRLYRELERKRYEQLMQEALLSSPA